MAALGLSAADLARVRGGGEVAEWLLQRAEEVVSRMSAEANASRVEADALLHDLESRFVSLASDAQDVAQERDRLRTEVTEKRTPLLLLRVCDCDDAAAPDVPPPARARVAACVAGVLSEQLQGDVSRLRQELAECSAALQGAELKVKGALEEKAAATASADRRQLEVDRLTGMSGPATVCCFLVFRLVAGIVVMAFVAVAAVLVAAAAAALVVVAVAAAVVAVVVVVLFCVVVVLVCDAALCAVRRWFCARLLWCESMLAAWRCAACRGAARAVGATARERRARVASDAGRRGGQGSADASAAVAGPCVAREAAAGGAEPLAELAGGGEGESRYFLAVRVRDSGPHHCCGLDADLTAIGGSPTLVSRSPGFGGNRTLPALCSWSLRTKSCRVSCSVQAEPQDRGIEAISG